MSKFLIVLASVVMIQTMAQAATYSIDPMHSNVGFSIRHMMISNVKGTFGEVSGKIVIDEKDHSKDLADVVIKVASIKTGVDKRDQHLLSPDFFDVKKFPLMKFKSTKVTASGDSKMTVVGDLTLHGVTKPVSLDVEFLGTTKGPDGEQHAGFTASGKINRKDFGLTWQKPMEKAGAVMVGEDVALNLEIESVQDKVAPKK